MQNPPYSFNQINLATSVKTKFFHYRKPFELEGGAILPELQIAYHTYGTLNEAKDNVVWVCHALTANADVADWWNGLVGEGFLIDPKEHFIVCANMLGSCYGSSSPTTHNLITNETYYIDFPQVSVKDMVKAHDLLRQELGIEEISVCIGGSMGGQQVLEWAILQPEIFKKLVLLATNAKHSPWGIAFNESQRLAIYADSTWNELRQDAGQAGLCAARSIALLSYRNYGTYVNRQSEETNEKTDDFKASSYQRYQGVKLVRRFNVLSYLILSKAMDSGDWHYFRYFVPTFGTAVFGKAHSQCPIRRDRFSLRTRRFFGRNSENYRGFEGVFRVIVLFPLKINSKNKEKSCN